MENINTKNDLITLSIGKILIIRKNGKKEFLKVNEDNTVRELNEEEKKYIDNIFGVKYEEWIYSKSAIDIARENANFKGTYNYLLPIIDEIDKIIPESKKENFYRNLKTLTTELAANNKESKTPEIMKRGGYNIRQNKITMSPEYINTLKYLEQTGKIDNFELEYSNTLIHELLHMASSSYDKENSVLKSGYYKASKDEKNCSRNRGLTEGITDVLTERVTEKLYGNTAKEQKTSAYAKEKLIAKQLQMFARNELIGEYFNADGCQKLKEKMKEYYQDFDNAEEIVEELFDNIEDGFVLSDYEHEENFQSTILLKIQNTLLTALESKIEQDVRSGKLSSEEEVAEYLDIYARNLLTPESLHIQEGEQSKFSGLEMVTDRFDGIKKKYKQMVVDEKQQKATTEVPIVEHTENQPQQQNTVVENKITPQQIEQATENVTISMINNEIAISEKIVETPTIEQKSI